MNKQRIQEAALCHAAGNDDLSQVVQRLLVAGVESYLVDFAAAQKTHYLADGTTLTVPMILEPGPIAEEFDEAALVAAIRDAQADTVRYPEFVKRALSGRRHNASPCR